MPPKIHRSATPTAVAEDFARFFAETVRKQPDFTVALSGGSTPKLLFQHWAEAYRDRIDWSNIHFFWGDERCVPPNDPESNFGVTDDLLLQHLDLSPDNIHRIHGEADPPEEVQRYATEIEVNTRSVNGLPQFDLIILGMGSDGHTASIFPHQLELWNKKTPTVLATHPETGQQRISLSGQVINNAKQVAFLVTGESKRKKVKGIFGESQESKQWPAAHVKPTSGQLHWFVDEASWPA
ncbi:MAG: 6-phosphogluconolactonase [Bacteroidota bacterium]